MVGRNRKNGGNRMGCRERCRERGKELETHRETDMRGGCRDR